MGKTYPDIYIPTAIARIQNSLPSVPQEPRSPSPLNESTPQIFSNAVKWLIGLGVVLSFVGLFSNFPLLTGLSVVSSLGVGLMSWLSYGSRRSKFEERMRSFDEKQRRYLQSKQRHDETIRKIHSPENIREHRETLRNEELKNTISPDGIGSNAQRGWSEGRFGRFLHQYFPNKIKTGHIVANPAYESGYAYTPDFCYIDEALNLHIDIEIDEPYAHKSRKPTHYVEDNNESTRNRFFNEDRGWIVIRFAEEQVWCYPNQCCKVIAHLIHDVTGKAVSPEFANITELTLIPRWNLNQAKNMADDDYRQTYLN